MKKFVTRHTLPFLCWLLLLVIVFGCSSYHMRSLRVAAEEMWANRASQLAEQLASFLALPGWNLEKPTATAVVFAAMENKDLYAVTVSKKDVLLEGQRRTTSGELEPWDGVFLERTVHASTPILVDDSNMGMVGVYLRQEPMHAFIDDVAFQEIIRFTLVFLFATACLFLYLVHAGELPYLSAFVKTLWERCQHLVRRKNAESDSESQSSKNLPAPISLDAGRFSQGTDARANRVMAQLFHRSFALAPDVMLRFVAEKNVDGLMHLARLLEQSAPYLGASDLQKKAIRLQEALLQSPEEIFSQEVEACIQSLENVLAALDV